MTARTRYLALGLTGKQSSTDNEQDSFIKTFEFNINAIASGAEQDTGIAAPSGIIQVISAYIDVGTAEVTGTTKTVDVGIVGQPAVFLNDADVSATGPSGTPVTAAISGGANFSFTLASANFAELVSRCVVTVLATDA